jgi:hypothetical protein
LTTVPPLISVRMRSSGPPVCDGSGEGVSALTLPVAAGGAILALPSRGVEAGRIIRR